MATRLPQAFSPGLSYWLGTKLYVSLTDRVTLSGTSTLLSLRGPGFKMPAESCFQPLGAHPEPSAEEIAAVVDSAYASDPRKIVGGMGEEDTGVTFAGLGEPLLRWQELSEASALILERRHGIPLRVKTSGILPPDVVSAQVLENLVDAGVGFISVSLPAANPKAYSEAMRLDEKSGSRVFGGVCDFISQAALSGLQVECVGIGRPGVDIAAIRQLAEALGAVSTRVVSFAP